MVRFTFPTDNGATWTDVTPPSMPPEGRIQTIDPSPHDAAKAYVAGYRYLLGDYAPYIYRTSDYGQSWTLLTDGTNGIPADAPTRVIREDPGRAGLLYAGTEFGMYISFNDGLNWTPFQQGLPVTPITDIKVHRQDLVLSTMGRGFWIMDDITPLHELTPELAGADVHFFAPRDAYRLRYRSSGGGAAGPQYPGPGVHIDYFLHAAAVGPAEIRIMTSDGETIRTYAAGEPAMQPDEEEQGMRAPPAERKAPDDFSVDAGMHRFVWDLRHEGPLNSSLNPGNGPMALPGDYRIQLSINGSVHEHTVSVLMDPRVIGRRSHPAGISLSSSPSIRWLARPLRRAGRPLPESTARWPAWSPRKTAGSKRPLNRSGYGWSPTIRYSYPPPMLMSQLGYLLSMTSRADQHPGDDAYARYEQLRAELSNYVSEVDDLESRLREALRATMD